MFDIGMLANSSSAKCVIINADTHPPNTSYTRLGDMEVAHSNWTGGLVGKSSPCYLVFLSPLSIYGCGVLICPKDNRGLCPLQYQQVSRLSKMVEV